MITTRTYKSALVMLFALGLFLASGCSSPADSDADADSQASSTASAPEPEVSITAVELANAYKADSSAADGKYKDKWLKVTGQLAGPPTTDAGGDRFIQFLQPDEDGELWAETFVYLLPEEIKKLDELWRRQEMTIVGKCLGNPVTYPLLLECRIVATGEPIPVIEITAGDLIKQYQEDAKAADKKYEDKVLVISGVVVANDSDEQVVDIAGRGDVDDDPMLVQIKYTLSEDDLVAALKAYHPGDKIRFKADCGGKPGQDRITMWYARILAPESGANAPEPAAEVESSSDDQAKAEDPTNDYSGWLQVADEEKSFQFALPAGSTSPYDLGDGFKPLKASDEGTIVAGNLLRARTPTGMQLMFQKAAADEPMTTEQEARALLPTMSYTIRIGAIAAQKTLERKVVRQSGGIGVQFLYQSDWNPLDSLEDDGDNRVVVRVVQVDGTNYMFTVVVPQEKFAAKEVESILNSLNVERGATPSAP